MASWRGGNTTLVVRITFKHTKPTEVRVVRGNVLRCAEILHKVRTSVLLFRVRVRIHLSRASSESGGVLVKLFKA